MKKKQTNKQKKKNKKKNKKTNKQNTWAAGMLRHKWAASWENQQSAYAKTKTQFSFAVTAKLISAFVFTTWIAQSLYFLNPKFQASSHLQ